MASIRTTLVQVGVCIVAISMSGSAKADSVTTTNTTTGSDSTNGATISVSRTTTDQEINNSTVTSNVVLSANTGNNRITNNTSVSGSGTGDVVAHVEVANTANNSVGDGSSANVAPTSSIEVTTVNHETGPNSTNTTTATLSDTSTINRFNGAAVSNLVLLSATTGGNELDSSTQVSGWKTGSILFDVIISTTTNTHIPSPTPSPSSPPLPVGNPVIIPTSGFGGRGGGSIVLPVIEAVQAAVATSGKGGGAFLPTGASQGMTAMIPVALISLVLGLTAVSPRKRGAKRA